MNNDEICGIIRDNPGLTNEQLGSMAGVSERTIRRRKSEMRSLPEPFFTDVPREIITSRGRSIRTEDGWEKITYRPQDLAKLEAAKYEDVEAAIAAWTPQAPPKTAPNLRTEVLCMADFQVGKTASGGGTQQLVDRVLASTQHFVDRIEQTKPALVILAELGDVLENFDNVGSQRATNDLDLTQQIRTARRLVTEVILRVAPYAPRVVVPSVPSNHAAVRLAGSKDFASNPNNDWGVELSYQLEEKFADREGLEHVMFRRTEGYDEALTVGLPDGTVVGFVHGHQASADKIGDWWKGQSHGRRVGLHLADILFHGHYHNFSVRQTGDERWIIGTSSSDGGSDWFANKTGDTAKVGMTMLAIENRMWRDIEIV